MTLGTEVIQVKAGRSLAAFDAASAKTLADAIERVSRELGRSVPPPRGAPFYHLEYAPGDCTPLDVFNSRGIFRKYEHALHIGAGLGAPARWWAVHFGCTVLGIDHSHARVWAATRLTARAALANQVQFQVGDATALPLRGRYFTHVWAGDVLNALPDPLAALREAWRVLRPGGYFALRLCVATGTDDGALARVDNWRARVAAAGFIEVEAQAAAVSHPGQLAQLAQQRLDRVLMESGAPGAQLARQLAAARAAAAREHHLALVFARRPA